MLVSWSVAERYATSAEVIWLVANTSWSGPVRLARDGRLRLRPARLLTARLLGGVVGQQRGRLRPALPLCTECPLSPLEKV